MGTVMADDSKAEPPPSEVFDLVADVLTSSGLQADVVGERRLMTMLSGEHKRTIPVLFEVGERTLATTSAFVGVLDEGRAEVYELLLHRNERSRHVHFAMDDAGHLVLVGRTPLAAVDWSLLEELLGEVLSTADSTFNAVLRSGFANYLRHEQRWRANSGLPPNPIGPSQD